ncbi:sensor histidine kinase [Carboxylicivirga marina]|uniref:sensor histidine kinase n=1 Tax=Carboxylicivirga marina TaxID=2800988 RepID=UPI002599154E|nr:ATP-binding protein [uncultured Carboxylicivirga sp.]
MEISFANTSHKEELLITSDETRLKQVLINLINNAIKYTEKGSVKVDYNTNASHVIFRVSDTGVGIHPDNIETIFERFVKIEGENTVKDGTGLGLAISKSIIETLGGELAVSSELSKGSVFTVTLPLQTAKTLPSSNSENALTA